MFLFSVSGFPVIIKFQPATCNLQPAKQTCRFTIRDLKQSAHDTKFFIILFERAFKIMKNGVYFILIALLVAELLKILIYAN